MATHTTHLACAIWPSFPSPGTRSGGRTTTVVPVFPTMPEKTKPVTKLPPPRAEKVYDIHVYEPNRG